MMQRHQRTPPAQIERSPRHGAAAVESAVVLSVLLTILFGMLDLALATMRQNTLTEASRFLARSAIVHGRLASPGLGSWGADTYMATAADASPQATLIKPLLASMDPAAVSMTLQWPDTDNQPDHRVVATLSYSHQPIIPFIFGSRPINLSATSTMRISH